MRLAPLLLVLLLHDPESADVAVNSEHITTLRAPRGNENKNFTAKARCMVNTIDGRFVAVVETCATVLRMLENKQ
jgi:hypothetical protein